MVLSLEDWIGLFLLGWHLTCNILIDRNSRDVNQRMAQDLISSSSETIVAQLYQYMLIRFRKKGNYLEA